jgi:two-component system sensor kinase FixL
VRDAAGRVYRILGIAEDVTEVRQAAEARERLNAELEQRVAERTRELRAANEALQAEIAERRRVEEALRRSERLARERLEEVDNLYHHAPCGYHSIDENSVFVRINDTELAWLGYTRDEVVGKMRFADVLTPPGRALFERAFPAYIKTGYAANLEFELIRKDGSTLPVLLNCTAMRDAQGRFIMSRTTMVDLTERRRAEATAARLTAELARMNRLITLGEMAAALAHELNQPLAAIVNFTRGSQRLLAERPDDPAAVAGALESVAVQADRAGAIIRSLRRFLRRCEPRGTQQDVNNLVREVMELAEADARTHRVSVRLSLADALPPVVADRIQIQQVILNLSRNAIEAMSANGSEPRELTVQTSCNGDGMVEVAIHDTGPGLPPAAPSEPFEQFFTTKPDGLGMGLWISRSIVEAHGGKLHSRPGECRGTTFWFTLPIGTTPI